MHPVKKVTQEDTWRADDLKVYLQSQREESRRRSREEVHRDGQPVDRRHGDPTRVEGKPRDGESKRESSKQRDTLLEDAKQDRYKERKRDRERTRHHDEVEKRDDRTADRHKERRRDWEKTRYGDEDTEKDDRGNVENLKRLRDGAKDRYKEGRRERERTRHHDEEEKRDDRGNMESTERLRDVAEKQRKERRDRERERHGGREEKRDDRGKVESYERHGAEGRHKERRRDRERVRYGDEEEKRDGRWSVENTEGLRDGFKDRHKERDLEKYNKSERDGRADRDGEKKIVSDRRKERGRDEREKEREKRERQRDGDQNRRGYEEKHRGENRRERYGDNEQVESNKGNDRDKEKTREKEEVARWMERRSSRVRKNDPSSQKDKQVENEEAEEDKEASKEDNNDYEEDFEDYEEDFEDSDEEEDEEEEKSEEQEKEQARVLSPERKEEIEAIQRAIDEENERIYSARSKLSSAESTVSKRESSSNRSQPSGKIIDFVSAKQREVSQKMAMKQKKRSEELLRLIDLDFSVTFSLLDLPPVNEYDMYIKNFGAANTKQAYVQCNEDNTEREIQTEEVELIEKWTQHPPEAKAACGGPGVSQDIAAESIARTSTDLKHLTTFLHSAAQVMAVLIEENMAESSSIRKLRSQTDALSFSDGCIQINTKLPFLHGRRVSLLHFSQAQRQTFLSVHPPSSKTSSVQLDTETVVCVWNIWEPTRPQIILLYESEVRCCCFSPGKVALVFAGTAVGSVVVWDLREPSGSHFSLEIGKETWTLRYPTFSTDAVLSGVGHFSPVVSIEPVLSSVEGSESTLNADKDESLGLSFQLGSLDENGFLTLWVVVELTKGDDSGSQTDLGLRPGGKVKLLHSSSIQTTERLPTDSLMGFAPSVSLQLKFLPSDSNHYFIGTNMGMVRHGTRHNMKVLPKFYRSQFDRCRPVEVTALEFSPFGEPFFLVGCSDGTVRLHSVPREDPLIEWSGHPNGPPILSVHWSQTRPTVFCVLYANSDLHIWDLLEKDNVPVIKENIQSDGVTAMAVFGDATKQNPFSGIALAKKSGKVEIQYFKSSLTVSSASDKENLECALHDVF